MFSTTSHLSLTETDRRFLAQLQQLDLQPIADTLIQPVGVIPAMAGQLIQPRLLAYLQFLFLMYRYPRANLVPPKAIAPIWQAHVLNTPKYHQDCQWLFGRLDLAHHQACPLPLSPAEQQQFVDHFATTCTLFEKHFPFPAVLLDQPGACLRPGQP